MITIEKFAEKLLQEKSVALFCHVRPDGDTLCSALALKCALESLNKCADVYSTDEVPVHFLFLPEAKKVKYKLCGEYSAFVAIDNAEPTRIGVFYEGFAKHKNTYNLDHHISNTLYAKNNCVICRASNSENVLELIKAMKVTVTENMANLLATGLVTDTGAFRHKNVTEETMMNASFLVGCGADLNKIIYNTFTKQTQARAKLFGRTMSKIRYFKDGKFAVATVFKKDVEECGARQDETEGFIDFVMGVETVEIGACVMEMDKNKYKISLRSKRADVNAVASAFGGGGHVLASGCQIQGEYEEVVDRLCVEAYKYIDD